MDPRNALGEFLRVRREALEPAQVGLRPGGRRRVDGLRREEVAAIAGVSLDYYTRLEQGRSQNPSAQVVDALAKALRLDVDATAHLHELASPRTAAEPVARQVEAVTPMLGKIVDSWTRTPAFIVGRTLDVLASNAIARAISPMHAVGANLLRAVFTDPEAAIKHPDHERFGERVVATLRAAVGINLDDPELDALVAEVSERSERFRELWARQLVRSRGDGVKVFAHPLLGEFSLPYQTFGVNGHESRGQVLIVYYVEPGSDGARAVDDLLAVADQTDRTST